MQTLPPLLHRTALAHFRDILLPRCHSARGGTRSAGPKTFPFFPVVVPFFPGFFPFQGRVRSQPPFFYKVHLTCFQLIISRKLFPHLTCSFLSPPMYARPTKILRSPSIPDSSEFSLCLFIPLVGPPFPFFQDPFFFLRALSRFSLNWPFLLDPLFLSPPNFVAFFPDTDSESQRFGDQTPFFFPFLRAFSLEQHTYFFKLRGFVRMGYFPPPLFYSFSFCIFFSHR